MTRQGQRTRDQGPRTKDKAPKMNDARWYLVCYDVHDPARLRRCAGILEGAGQRIQESVFRCWLTRPQMHRLRWELTEALQPEDEVLFIPLCPRCVAGMQTTFSARKTPDWPDAPESHRVV